jgi:hypothetical protein
MQTSCGPVAEGRAAALRGADWCRFSVAGSTHGSLLRDWASTHRPEPTGDVMLQTMSRAEREQFLAGVHVGVLSVGSADGPRTLAVPVWYSYQPGGRVSVITGRTTRGPAR